MKKLLCVLLSAMLIIGTCVFAVNAVENPKIDRDLAEALNNSPDDIFTVYISLKPVTSESEVERIVAEKYTWTTANEYLKYYRAELKSIVEPYVQQFIDDNGGLLEKIRYQGKLTENVIADVKREHIPALADLNTVTELSYFENVQPEPETENLFRDVFLNRAVSKFGEACLTDGYEYNELYIHYSGDEPDWVLVNAEFLLPSPSVETWVQIGGIGGRTVFGPSLGSPFLTGYGIYDVADNEFYGLEEFADDYSKLTEVNRLPFNYERYEGLLDALADLDICYPTGDANTDRTVDIIDATEIQKATVDKVKLSKKQIVIADVNDDDQADILDATAIQKALVA